MVCDVLFVAARCVFVSVFVDLCVLLVFNVLVCFICELLWVVALCVFCLCALLSLCVCVCL